MKTIPLIHNIRGFFIILGVSKRSI